MTDARSRPIDRPLSRRQLFLFAGVAGAAGVLASVAGTGRGDAEPVHTAAAAPPPDYRAIVGLL